MVELGPFNWKQLIIRSDFVFSDSNKTMSFNQFQNLTYNPALSCKDKCQSSNEFFYTANIAWQSILQASKSEGTLMLSLYCTPTQIGLISTAATGFSVLCLDDIFYIPGY